MLSFQSAIYFVISRKTLRENLSEVHLKEDIFQSTRKIRSMFCIKFPGQQVSMGEGEIIFINITEE